MGAYHSKPCHPGNFILLGAPGGWKARAEAIVSEASVRFPECFEGRKNAFSFELRYIPPFDKGFHELKRLQGEAAEAAGRRDAFRGYIILNLSQYLTHEGERYFDIALHFLIDQSDCWKYIFLVDNRNSKAAKALTGKVLAVLLRDIPCEVEEDNRTPSTKDLVNTLCQKQGVFCSPPVKAFLQELLEESFSTEVVCALLQDISSHCGPRLTKDALTDFFANRESVVKYLVSQKRFDQLMDSYEHRKEQWYGAKESI